MREVDPQFHLTAIREWIRHATDQANRRSLSRAIVQDLVAGGSENVKRSQIGDARHAR